MAKTLITTLGPAGTPREVKNLRQASFDLHEQIGSAVIFKHRWTQDDVLAGKTTVCPLHDELYGNRDGEWDPVCFGTGFTGGYSDGQIIYLTIQDAQETAIKVGQSGILQMDMHPAITGPWLPTMGDGDLIITADFASGSWEIVDLHERYVLRDVTPITMRGPYWGRQGGAVATRQIISQQSQADRLPYNHPLYQVPVVFDYSKVPSDNNPPYDPSATNYTEVALSAFIHGIEPNDAPSPDTSGTKTSTEVAVFVHGVVTDGGTTIDF